MMSSCRFTCLDPECNRTEPFSERIGPNDQTEDGDPVTCPDCGSRNVKYIDTYQVG